MKTLLLDRTEWDLLIDLNGNIAVAEDPYAITQDVASAVRLFLGELWYDTAAGIPYYTTTLGKFPPVQLLKQQIADQAETVPGVLKATVFLSSLNERSVSGQVQITTTSGTTVTAEF